MTTSKKKVGGGIEITSPESILKSLDEKYATIVGKGGILAGDFEKYSSTGSFVINALISSSIFGGIPDGKVVGLGGTQGTGKTFLLLSSIKSFLDTRKNGIAILFETESGLTTQILKERGIDLNRVIVVPVDVVEVFKNKILKFLEDYLQTPEDQRIPVFLALDSLGNLATRKETEDAIGGDEKKDLTRAQAIKSLFRLIKIRLGIAQIPFLFTNHLYQTLDMFSTQRLSGGSGPLYNADIIVLLKRKKMKDQTGQTGNIVFCSLFKGRLAKEGIVCESRVFFDKRGWDKYYGLLDVGVEGGLFYKIGNRIAFPTQVLKIYKPKSPSDKEIISDIKKLLKIKSSNGIKATDTNEFIVFTTPKSGKESLLSVYSKRFKVLTKVSPLSPSTIYKHPEKYFKDEILQILDMCASWLFSYGGTIDIIGNDAKNEYLSSKQSN